MRSLQIWVLNIIGFFLSWYYLLYSIGELHSTGSALFLIFSRIDLWWIGFIEGSMAKYRGLFHLGIYVQKVARSLILLIPTIYCD